MTGEFVGAIGSAGEQNGRVFGSAGNEYDGEQLDAIAHGNHEFAANVIEAVGLGLKILRRFAGKIGVLGSLPRTESG
jgi:hypothetical protein